MQQLRSRTWRWVWRVRGPILHSGRKFINSSQNLLRQKSEEIHIATCQIITILCLWALRLRGLCNSATLCQVLKLPSTYGAYGPQGIKLVKQIGKKIQDATGEKLSTFYLFQSISMAIQRGNAVCVMGCPKDRSPGLEGLFNFQVYEAEELW